MTDSQILKQLENEIGKKLRQITSGDIMDYDLSGGFTIDENGNVIGLNLGASGLTIFPSSMLKLKNLQKLDLSRNQLKKLPSGLSEIKYLQELDLSSNRLTQLPVEMSTLNQIQKLNLYHNKLTQLPAEISELKNLQELYLSENRLTQLPAEISKLKNLQKLDLSYNKLTQLPTEISGLKNLQELDLTGNQLTQLPAAISGLINLQELNLYNNQLTQLPAAISELKNLQILNLTDNELTQFPASILELKNLQILNLSSNQLTQLPAKISELENLQKLNLYHNQLTQLPAKISELKNLQVLDLTGKKLSQLPVEISELKNLQVLDLSYNQLTQLPAAISGLKNLQKLDLTGNKLSQLPVEISELKNLQELDLRYNQLTQLPVEISELKNLQVLDLSYNQLTQFPVEISELKNLQVLDLSGNQLTQLPAAISELKNLQELILYKNQLTQLPVEILELNLEIKWEYYGKDKGIYLSGNPLESPPVEIVKKGRDAVKAYFKSLEGEKQALNEVKVLLVGDGGAGKTSLVKRLLKIKFNKREPQTHGINIKPWEIKAGDNSVKAHLWDFGGQEIMHATHQFFLSKRSLYILVLDCRKDDKTEYWLKHIESFGGDSPILVVINKTDENPGFDVNRNFLLDKYKGIKGFYRISCAKNTGIKAFARALKDALADVELLKTTWATSWFKVKTHLENMTDYFISYDDYIEICEKEDIKDKTGQDTLVDFLNDLGVILHFKDFELLDTHVLEPKWVTEAVYKIINSKKLAKTKGVLELKSLDEILKKRQTDKFHYPRKKHKFIINLMKKFELCYPLDSETILIPDLLEIQEPTIDSDYEFDYENSLKFIIEYDFLPKSIMPRFIVKMHKDIKGDLRWRTGVVLENKAFHSTAVIKSDDEAKKVYVWVNGKLKRDYLSIIRFTLNEINGSFEKLDAKEMVPCNCDSCRKIEKPHFFRYDTMIKFQQKGIKEVPCELSTVNVSIDKLLSGIEVIKKEDDDRTQKYGNTYISMNQTSVQEVEQSQVTNVKINIKIELPKLQNDFRKFKEEVSKSDKELNNKLTSIEDDLLEITPNSDQGKINRAINKVSSFLHDLKNKDSKFRKAISKTKKGGKALLEFAETYNRIAESLGLDKITNLLP